jgi:preprotein translocase subunit SecG
MDGATIFVAVLSAVFFGFIIFLAVKSRRTGDADAPKAKTQPRIEPQKPIDHKPRNVA